MSTQEGKQKRPQNQEKRNHWATQSDRELIAAARDSKTVMLHFDLDDILNGEGHLCKIQVVDRYFIRIMLDGASVWVAKSQLVGFTVVAP